MRRIEASSAVVVVLSVAVFAQPAQFEVASVRASGQDLSVGVGVHIDGAQVRITNLPLKLYVGTAFGLKPQQIVGPDWLGQPHFDVAAKIPEGATPEQVPAMLQALLADRFQMKSHRETRDFAVLALKTTKEGFRLRPVAPDARTSRDERPGVNVTAGSTPGGGGADLGRGSSFTVANNHVEIHRMTLASIAELLTRLSDRPVIDATGIEGAFDLTLEMTAEEFTAAQIRGALNNGVIIAPQALRTLENVGSDAFSNALQKVGLTLESRKAPLDVLVIDSIQKTPTQN